MHIHIYNFAYYLDISYYLHYNPTPLFYSNIETQFLKVTGKRDKSLMPNVSVSK